MVSSQSSSLLGLLGVLSGLHSLAVVSLVHSGLSESGIHSGILHLGGHSGELLGVVSGGESEDTVGGVLGSRLELIGRRIVDQSLLGLVSSSGEQDKFLLVLVQSGNVQGHGVGVLVVSSVVNSDSNGSSPGGGQAGLLQLSKREASSELDLGTVAESLAVDDGSKLADGGDSSGGGLGSSVLSADGLVSRLVEEALDSPHPVLSQVRALNDIIVFYHVAY